MTRAFSAKKSKADETITLDESKMILEDIESAEDTEDLLQQANELAEEVLGKFSL